MKIFKQIFTTAILSITVFAGFSASTYAEPIPVKQDAYYDTFIFYVNGSMPSINDIALKPFASNNRIYLPIRTLSDLGLVKLKYTPASGGLPATLHVEPAASAENTNLTLENNNLRATNTMLQSKIDELEKKVSSLTSENESLKKNSKKSSSSDGKVRDYRDRETETLVRDLDRLLSRDRDFTEVRIDGKNYNLKYDLSYRRGFRVDVVIERLGDDATRYLIDKDYRNLEYILEDIAKEIEDDFWDVDIDFVVYRDTIDSKNELGSYIYEIDDEGYSRRGLDGRLR